MNRRAFLSACGAVALGAADRPAFTNVVILLADDLGWADVGFHDSEILTPNIDRFSREGTRLERFYSCPVCSPTRASLMTGRSPMRYGVMYTVIRPYFNYGVPLEEHFMPQTFQAAGYQTAITGKWHLGHSKAQYLPRARGFDHSYGHMNGAIDYYTHERDGGLDWNRDGKSLREEGYSTDLIGAEAARLIKTRDHSKPLFLYVPFNAPHAPLEAPKALLDKYANLRDKDPNRRPYAAMVDSLDTAIGKVLSTIDEEGMRDNTLVLFFSDNGGPTDYGARNAPLRGGKATTFEGGTRVPAVVRWPGHVKAGARSNQRMSAYDVFPTLAGAVGITPKNTLPLDGKNMWPAISGGRIEPREDLLLAVDAGAKTYYCVHHGDWKLVREELRDKHIIKDYLFRPEEDPSEAHDLAAQHPDVVADLVARVDKWRALYPSGGLRGTDPVPQNYTAPKLWAEAARQ
jgi:arylsulfatase A-like enzyme